MEFDFAGGLTVGWLLQTSGCTGKSEVGEFPHLKQQWLMPPQPGKGCVSLLQALQGREVWAGSLAGLEQSP